MAFYHATISLFTVPRTILKGVLNTIFTQFFIEQMELVVSLVIGENNLKF